MEKNTTLLKAATSRHLISLAAERTAYYGLRATLVLYLVGETMNLPNSKAIGIYGVFTSIVLFGTLLGALLGDLILGNKNAVQLGGALQMLGAITFCFPNIIGVYIGIGLISFGSGLYGPNLFSQYSKLILSRTQDTDVDFLMYYLMLSAGGFIGALLIAYIGEIDYRLGFISCASLFLLSFLLLRRKEFPLANVLKRNYSLPKNARNLNLAIVILISGLYWAASNFGNGGAYETIYFALENIETNGFKSLIQNHAGISSVLFCIIALVIWKNKNVNSIYKIIIGLFTGFLGFGILLILTSNGTPSNLFVILIALSLLGLSEALVAPTIFSLIVKYVNPKFFATAKSLLVIPTRIFAGLFAYTFISDHGLDYTQRIMQIAAVILLIMAASVYLLRNRFLKGVTTPSEIDEIGKLED